MNLGTFKATGRDHALPLAAQVADTVATAAGVDPTLSLVEDTLEVDLGPITPHLADVLDAQITKRLGDSFVVELEGTVLRITLKRGPGRPRKATDAAE